MKAAAPESLQVTLAVVSLASGMPTSVYDCCIAGIASTALPCSSVSRSSLAENQSSASTSVAGSKSPNIRFSFQAHVTTTMPLAGIASLPAGRAPWSCMQPSMPQTSQQPSPWSWPPPSIGVVPPPVDPGRVCQPSVTWPAGASGVSSASRLTSATWSAVNPNGTSSWSSTTWSW